MTSDICLRLFSLWAKIKIRTVYLLSRQCGDTVNDDVLRFSQHKHRTAFAQQIDRRTDEDDKYSWHPLDGASPTTTTNTTTMRQYDCIRNVHQPPLQCGGPMPKCNITMFSSRYKKLQKEIETTARVAEIDKG